MSIDETRVLKKNNLLYKGGSVYYWMIRDQRIEDNWALLHAKHLAEKNRVELVVFMVIRSDLFNHRVSKRSLDFMISGLKKLEKNLRKKNIDFRIFVGKPVSLVDRLVEKKKIGYLVSDMSPLRVHRGWHAMVSKKINIPFDVVDAHNIIPVWEASKKQEYAAYTIRPKIHKLLGKYLTDFPKVSKHKHNKLGKPVLWKKIGKSLRAENLGLDLNFVSGSDEAKKVFDLFLNKKLVVYDAKRNDPNKDVVSDMSPYLHFGQISPQKMAYHMKTKLKSTKNTMAYLEELIVRKELADNYCFYNQDYKTWKGFPDWAKKTLKEHAEDKRTYVYSKEEFESAKTHDKLWNAAEIQLVLTGKLNGYMRMYWAKKVLEWSVSYKEAQKILIYLNDLYSLDGRDSSGYTGIAWSVGGVHDRAWSEREIFGKIRYMSYSGAKRKFDVDRYINTWIK